MEHFETYVELAATPVDQNQVRQRVYLLQRLREPPREDLAQRGEFVGACDRPDAEALVVVLLHPPVLPRDQRADLLRALDVGDVVALDPVGRAREVERAPQLLQHDLLAVVAREEVVLQRERRVLLGHGDELAPPAALRPQDLDPPARQPPDPPRAPRALAD